jgi:glutathione S-transferase
MNRGEKLQPEAMMAEPYTLVIGNANWSSWSLRPWLALMHKGIEFEEIRIQLRNQPQTREDALKYSPSGKVPLLQTEHGPVWDSLAILETLAEWHPELKLWPEDPVLRARARSVSAEMHSGFMPLRNTLPMDFARQLPTPELGEDVKNDIARILSIWETAIAHTKGNFLFGDFSIADCMYAPVVSRFRTYSIAMSGAAKDYAERIMNLPSMQVWMSKAKAEIKAGVS